MGNSFRRDGLYGLSKLKLIRVLPFFSKRNLSGFALIFLGTSGIFPALPMVDTKEIETPSTEVVAEIVAINPKELCQWQRDFSFFNRLLGEKKLSDETEPCQEEVVAKVTPVVPEATPEQDEDLKKFIDEMVAGYPIAVMAPAIAEYDREVAALIVGIAKKESNWGKRVPVDATGADCFNYWGWKGAGARGVAMGHGCFGTPEEAVQAVGNRIAQLVELRKTSEPKNMIVWKCGSSCATHSPESVRKWIADVDLYYRKIVQN